MSFKYIAAALAVALAGGSLAFADDSADKAGLEAALEGFERTGETRNCLNTRFIRKIDPIDDTHWRVETRGGDTYLNIVRGSCNDAGSSFTALQYTIPGGQLCRGEIVRVIDIGYGGTTRGACSLGEYEALSPIE